MRLRTLARFLPILLPLVPACSDEGSEEHLTTPANQSAAELPSGGAALGVANAMGGGPRKANEALVALERETGTSLFAKFSPRGGLAYLDGQIAGARASGESSEDAARRFLRARMDLTGIDEKELVFAGERNADGGGVVAWFERKVDGRRVLGSTVDVRFDASGALVAVTSGGWPDLSKREAASGITSDGEPIWYGTTPAFMVVTDDKTTYVSARDGAVLGEISNVVHAFAKVKMRDAIGVQRTIEVETTDANGGTMWSHDGNARHYANWCNGTTSCQLVGTPLQSAFPGPVVSALANVRAVRDFWRTTWGRDSVDGGKGLTIISYVHHGATSEQAQWSSLDGKNGLAGTLTFFVPGKEEFSTAGAVDLVGHEYTHGVVSYTLALGTEGGAGLREAKALNESLADVFGIYAKKFACDRGYTVNCGVLFHYNEMGFMRPYYVRDIADPAKPKAYSGPGKPQHDHYDDMLAVKAADADEHDDAGVTTKAWYLAARGGRHPRSKIGPRAGIGTKAAWEVWYAAAFAPNERAPSLGFHDFAVRTINAAKAKYGGIDAWQTRAVACAWRAVGVGSDWGQCDPCPSSSKTSTGGVRPQSFGADGTTCANVASFRDATAITNGTTTCGSVGAGGSSWMKIDAKSGERIDLSVKNATGDVDLQAYDASGNVLARSEQVGDRPEWLDLVPAADGPVFVRILGNERATFDMQMGDIEDDEVVLPPQDVCILPVKPSCEVEAEGFCGGGVCSRNGAGTYCCRAPIPVSKPCLGDGECGANEVCAQVTNTPDENGASFSCVPSGTDSCTD